MFGYDLLGRGTLPGQAEAAAARLDVSTTVEVPEPLAALEAFIGCADSGDPDWAGRDIHELRSEDPATRR